MDNDTDTLIALVSSIVGDQVDELAHSLILDALVDCDGDVERAADHLISKAKAKPIASKKRKRSGLDAWLDASPSQKKLNDDQKRVQHSSQVPKVSEGSKVSRIHASGTNADVKKVDLMSLLRQSSTSPQKLNPVKSKLKAPSNVPRLPPLSLPSPSLVAKHTPCTLHFSILPPELACKLFYTMVDLALGKSNGSSQPWKRNKWYLFDRLVESPHRTAFFVRQDLKGDPDDDQWAEAAQYWYNGRQTDPPPTFPHEMEEACYIIERMVNAELRKRQPYDREWRPKDASDTDVLWRANVAASNCYDGAKETVGWHSDQVTYLGPYPTIASLRTRRTFSLRDVVPADEQEKRHPRTYNIPLPHNSLIIMHASTQERFKHSIPPQRVIDLYKPILPRSAFRKPNASIDGLPRTGNDDDIEPSNIRINITFRFYRPDFRPETTPRCKCGVPMVLRPDMRHIVPKKAHASLDADSPANDEGAVSNQDFGMNYWWTCYAYAQNDGKGCGTWKVMDMDAEGRGWTEST